MHAPVLQGNPPLFQTEAGDEERPADVHAVLHFYRAPSDGVSPFFKVMHDSGAGIKNYSHDPHGVRICDMRPRLGWFKLDVHSFSAYENVEPFSFLDRSGPITPEPLLKEEVKDFLGTRLAGLQNIILFDCVVRCASKEERFCRPVRKVHIDQTPQGAWLRAKRHLDTQDYEAVQGGLRFRILNIWRPLNHTVLDHPLAVADSRTIEPDQLVEIEHIFPDRSGQTYGVRYSPAQQFWWWPRMAVTDVLIFQCFDSLREMRCAHASFESPASQAAQMRESVEVRCLVLG